MQQRSRETRDKILQTAQDLFSQHGYDATGVAEICAAAGLSKGAFYHHFDSKHAVFLHLLENWLLEFEGGLKLIQDIEATVPQKLVRMAELMQVVFETRRGQVPLFLEFWTQASRDEVTWQATVAPYRRYRQYFTAMIEQGIAEGSLKEVNADAAAAALVSLGVGLLLQGLLDPGGENWGKTAAASVKTVLQGLEKDPGRVQA